MFLTVAGYVPDGDKMNRDGGRMQSRTCHKFLTVMIVPEGYTTGRPEYNDNSRRHKIHVSNTASFLTDAAGPSRMTGAAR